MKELVVQGKTLVVSDAEYAFLKSRCVALLHVGGVDYPVVKLTTSTTLVGVDQKCVDLVKDFEGFRAKPYLCSAGVPTIGYGSTFYADGTKVTLADPHISKTDAEYLTKLVLDKMLVRVEKLVKVDLNKNQFSALVSFTYNLGVGAFSSSTLLKVINRGELHEAPAQIKRWNRAGGKVSSGLVRRRKAEADLWNLGV